jgi:hypothetical protein
MCWTIATNRIPKFCAWRNKMHPKLQSQFKCNTWPPDVQNWVAKDFNAEENRLQADQLAPHSVLVRQLLYYYYLESATCHPSIGSDPFKKNDLSLKINVIWNEAAFKFKYGAQFTHKILVSFSLCNENHFFMVGYAFDGIPRCGGVLSFPRRGLSCSCSLLCDLLSSRMIQKI